MAASIEQKKEIYAKQLAAHTLRQWNAVRQEPVVQRREKPAALPVPSDTERDDQENENASHRDNDGSNGQLTPGSRQKANGRRGVHVVDFGSRRSPKRPAQ